jgi:peptide subunit release factor 1 (eRF1)
MDETSARNVKENADFTLGVYTEVDVIPAMLQALRERALPKFGVLSAYLWTPPVQVMGQKYLVSFREECKQIRQEIESAGREERNAFETTVARVEEYLTEMPTPRHPGLAVFAASERGYLYAVPLPERPVTLVAWSAEPLLMPLEEVLDEHERVAVVLADKRQARLFTIYLGAIEEQRLFESPDPGVSNISGIAGNHARHYQENVQRHVRRTAHAATELLRARPFDRLILGGPDEVASTLKDELPRPLRARFAGILPIALEATDAEVLDAAREMAEEIERRTETEMVEELVESATAPRAALGLEPVLEALSDDRVHHLFIVSDFARDGAECPNCGRLVAGQDRDNCPRCGAKVEPLPDLAERIVNRALEQAAQVEMVSGEAAATLADYSGIGAWTRY